MTIQTNPVLSPCEHGIDPYKADCLGCIVGEEFPVDQTVIEALIAVEDAINELKAVDADLGKDVMTAFDAVTAWIWE